MNNETYVDILSVLRKEIDTLEGEIARGTYTCLSDFTKLQGRLYGLEQAVQIVHDILFEKEDQL